MDAITHLSIVHVSALIARRELSARDLVEATLRRIAETEPLIHAYALVLGDEARAAARVLDTELARGERRGPLHGIPIGVKDICYTAGIRTEAGSRALAGFVPSYDAAVVERLRAAGAIMIGKTATHELAYGVNEPPVRTPWRIDCYPGGSSAGSGAAVAARSAFGAIGTDTGGSIREPASLNGVIGLKPTFGLVSRHGIVPLSPSLDHAGPIARTVEDCAILLEVIAGHDPRDPGSIGAPPVAYGAHLDRGVEGLTIGVERRYFFGPHVWPEVRAAVDGVLADYAARGARVIEVELPELDQMSPAGMTILLVEANMAHRRLVRERGADLYPATRQMLELGALVPGTHYLSARRARRVLRDAMRACFERHRLDALLSPTVPTTTMPMALVAQGGDGAEDPLSTALHQMIPPNVTGQPALTVPCGFSAEGLPIGFQLMGRPFAEATLFRLARAYEAAHAYAAVVPSLRDRASG